MRPPGAEFWTPRGIHALRDRLSAEQGHRCAYCGVSMLPQRSGNRPGKNPAFYREITIDEVIPRCEGGRGSWDNTVAACRWCNQFRGRKPAGEAFRLIRQLMDRCMHPHVIDEMTFSDFAQRRPAKRPEAPT